MTVHLPAWTEMLIHTLVPWIVLLKQMPWVGIVVQILLAFLGASVLHRYGTRLLLRLAASLPFSRKLVLYGHRAGAVAVFLLATQIILRNAPDDLTGIAFARHVSALLLIIAITWLAVRDVKAVADTIIELNPANAADNLQARRIQTQTKVMARTLIVLIIVIGSGSALMTLPLLRQVGTSLLASAGFAGLVVGFAAKPILGNMLAGLQIALTQPIRLEDVVIVQGEWGWIEEITGTYVVVRIWDQRRMIIPLQWFIENPFQNWTRSTADLLGTVIIWADYRLPMDAFRAEAERICKNAPEWDGRLCLVQVTDTSEKAMQVRVLISAANADRAFELRCRVREGLLMFMQKNYPESLPTLRAEAHAFGRPPTDDPLETGMPAHR
jgi:small-conductance mechanosensitive channel